MNLMASILCSNLPAQKIHKKRAQTTVEFILMSTIVAVIVLGVFWPAFMSFIDGVRRDVFGDLKSVLAQDQIGIPLRWFGLEKYAFQYPPPDSSGGNSNGDLDKDKDTKNGEDGGSNDFSGDGFGSNGGGGSGGKDGRGGKGGKGGVGSDTDSNDSADSAAGGKGKGKKGSGDLLGEAGDTEGDSKKSKKTTVNAEDESALGDTENDNKDEEKAQAPKDKKKGGKISGVETGNTKRDLLGRKKISSGGGNCQDIDLFTLVKLGVIIGIFVLLAAVAVSAKGKKGGK